ncbi:MAG: hypothetical protein ABFR62_08985 [Bacteroidota bacterium]
MKRVIIFFIVFISIMFIANKLMTSSASDSIFIILLISALIASIAFWFLSVRENEKDNSDDI